jgi:hypothetical protein
MEGRERPIQPACPTPLQDLSAPGKTLLYKRTRYTQSKLHVVRFSNPLLPNHARHVVVADEPQSATADDGQVANGYTRFAARVVPTRRQYWDQ